MRRNALRTKCASRRLFAQVTSRFAIESLQKSSFRRGKFERAGKAFFMITICLAFSLMNEFYILLN